MNVVTVDDAVAAIEKIGGTWGRDKKRPDYLREVARKARLPYGAVQAIYYRKRKRLYAEEAAALSAILTAVRERTARLESAYAELAERADALGCAAPAASVPQPPDRSAAPQRGRGADRDAVEEAVARGESVVRPDER